MPTWGQEALTLLMQQTDRKPQEERDSHTCLWFQHVGHGHSSIHPHGWHVAIWEGLQQTCMLSDEQKISAEAQAGL